MQSYECVIISKMFLIYFISYGCNDSALVFLGGAEASASPSFALPMFITIKKIIILHLFLGVPAATVGGTGTPWHTRGYAPGSDSSAALGGHCIDIFINWLHPPSNKQTKQYANNTSRIPLYMKFIIKCICQSEVRASVGGS